MTRPEIIRADSMDLQDHDSPSAKDHTRKQPLKPSPLGTSPHQAEALREVAQEHAEQHQTSPRVSQDWNNGDVSRLHQYADDALADTDASMDGEKNQQQDPSAIAQNGGMTGSTTEDSDMADGEGDDGLDDDLMDKISSSPSIDDGGYFIPRMWPTRADSLIPKNTSTGSLFISQACNESSSLEERPEDDLPPIVLDEPSTQPEPSTAEARQSQSLLLRGEYSDDVLDARSSYNELSERSHAIDDIYDSGGYNSPQFTSETDGLLPLPSEIYRLDRYETGYANEYLDEGFEEDYSQYENPSKSQDTSDVNYDVLSTEISEEEDSDIFHSQSSRFIDSGWGGECLQDTEDIDFEFVYALHTFHATVEGQANATKGDTMVLLDDSNSYWWLVRVVKDSSIGYLPAEHIETPTERLARLNKHRNIDLTSTMLGDQAEKTKNPLKKVIRKRAAKSVTFSAPTYVEASDNDYSSDEEGDTELFSQEQTGEKQEAAQTTEEAAATVEPLKPRAELRDTNAEEKAVEGNDPDNENPFDDDVARTSDEIFEGRLESKSRNGTLRNTDSFFKDEETRKISLTPNLLRDDSSTSTRASGDSKEMKRPSFDKLDKEAAAERSRDKKNGKDRKEKEKKPGMLSGLFKRKDKKSRSQDEEDDFVSGKQSSDTARGTPSPTRDSEELITAEEQTQAQVQEPQRNPSKLQKQPRTEASPTRKQSVLREVKTSEPERSASPQRAPTGAPSSMRLVQPEAPTEAPQAQEPATDLRNGITPIMTAPVEQKPEGTISKILRSASSSGSDPKPIKAKKAKSRVALDEFDSSPDISPVEEPIRAPSGQSQRPIPGSFPDSYIASPQTEKPSLMEDTLLESPVEVSPIESPSQSYPPALEKDTSSQEERTSQRSSPSPDLLEADDIGEKKEVGGSQSSASTPTWSDAHLREFFDNDNEIKDLLTVVYDKSGVVPAGPDHPFVSNLFREENAKLADITGRLDSMLGDWLARKMRTQGSR